MVITVYTLVNTHIQKLARARANKFRNLKGRDDLGNVGSDGKLRLKWIFRNKL